MDAKWSITFSDSETAESGYLNCSDSARSRRLPWVPGRAFLVTTGIWVVFHWLSLVRLLSLNMIPWLCWPLAKALVAVCDSAPVTKEREQKEEPGKGLLFQGLNCMRGKGGAREEQGRGREGRRGRGSCVEGEGAVGGMEGGSLHP